MKLSLGARPGHPLVASLKDGRCHPPLERYITSRKIDF